MTPSVVACSSATFRRSSSFTTWKILKDFHRSASEEARLLGMGASARFARFLLCVLLSRWNAALSTAGRFSQGLFSLRALIVGQTCHRLFEVQKRNLSASGSEECKGPGLG